MTDITKYKTLLEAELTDLTDELKEIGIHNPKNPSDWIATPEGTGTAEADSNVGADRVEEWDERRGIVATLERRYNNITRALKKIEEGTYGTCEISGEEIEAERLDANPAARTCITHRDEEENLPQ